MGPKRSDKLHRPQITRSEVKKAVSYVESEIFRRLEEKGYGAWLSRHEILGVLTEEYKEIKDEVHGGTEERIRSELLDMAVGCIFSVACIDAKTLDW